MDDRQSQEALFPGLLPDPRPIPEASSALAPPRLRRANRSQMLLRPCALEELLEQDHPARIIWEMVGRWDLTRFLAAVHARGEAPGRPATDPVILISLWLYAYTRGIGNGRELNRLCQESDPYRWLCGGVSLNYHTINDFRVEHEKALDDLLTQMLAVLIDQKLVKVERISNDGTRIRAGAGRKSFKNREQLQDALRSARAHVAAVKRSAEDSRLNERRQKAQERAASERLKRIEKALEELAQIEDAKEKQKEKPSKHAPARASTSDPEARIMKQAQGGCGPGYNVQMAVDCGSGAILAVEVTNAGSDAQQSQPIRRQVEQRTGQKVQEQLMDGGFIGLESVEQATEAKVTVYAPVPKPKKPEQDRYQPRKDDSEAVAAWRRRMGTLEAQEIYKQRAQTIELANGECKTYRGLAGILVRGMKKVRCIALWSALAFNFVHFAQHLR